jgi:hypothetical protein
VVTPVSDGGADSADAHTGLPRSAPPRKRANGRHHLIRVIRRDRGLPRIPHAPRSFARHGSRRSRVVREPVARQPPGPPVWARRRQDIRGGRRERAQQSHPGVGGAQCRAENGPVHGRDGHGRAEPGLGRGVLPHQHAAVQHPQRGQPVQGRRGGQRAVERTGARRGADDGRFRHRLRQHVHRGAGTPAHLRRVRADHDRLHAGAGAGAEHDRQGLRRLRSLVLRGAVADVHEPVVLDRCDLLGHRDQQPGVELHPAQHGRDAVRPPGGARRSRCRFRSQA